MPRCALDEAETFAQLGERSRRPRRPRRRRRVALRRGGDGGSVKQNRAARKYSPPTMRISASAPATFTTSGPSRANPRAKAALSVSVKIPFAASSCFRSTMAGIIAASAGAKNVVTVETKMFRMRIATRLSPTSVQAEERHAAQEVRADEDDPPVEADRRRRPRPRRTARPARGTTGAAG